MEGKNETQKKLEIRTMAKDIARLRERATDSQRDKIVAIKAEPISQKINDAKTIYQAENPKVDVAKLEQERKEKELLARKIEEDRKIQRAREEEEKKKLEEIMLKAEMEARKGADIEEKIREASEKIKMEEMAKQEEIQKQEQEKIQKLQDTKAFQQRIEAEKERKEEEKMQIEEKSKQQESELVLAKQTREELKIEQEIKLKKQREQEKEKLAELLNKVKGPVDRIRERMEQKKNEKALGEQRPGIEGMFFKKVGGKGQEEKVAETSTEPKTPEQIMIEKLQRVEAQREREKQERENFLQRVTDEKIQTTPQSIQEEISATRFPLMSKSPLKKIPISEKVWVRVMVIGVLVTVWGILFTFNYWANVARKPVIVEQAPVQKEEPVPVLSRSIIPVADTKIIAFDTIADLKSNLALYFKEAYPEGTIRRIAFGDNQTKQYLTTQEAFEGLGISAPPAFFKKVDPDFTFFMYSKEAYNRFGIIVKINNRENFSELMDGWEPTMEDDLDPLYSIIGKNSPAIVTYFRSWKYGKYSYRFQTFRTDDMGVCYLTAGDYFILTSSSEGMTKVIELLK